MSPNYSSIMINELCCPSCRGRLDIRDGDVFHCLACNSSYPLREGIYRDFAPNYTAQSGLGQWVLESRAGVSIYERYLRVSFVRIMGQNWDGAFTPEAEDAYLEMQVAPAEGLILDLACGAGRWTRTLVKTFGVERVIGLDLSHTMLVRTHSILSDLKLFRGNATQLPFADASLGAINCSNSLQLFPDPQAAIAECGRCLKPGGSFTFFTYRQSSVPAYRLLQRSWEKLNRVQAFREEDLRAWLTQAGFRVTDISGPKLIMLGTALRTET